jgi:hypothetical protein
VIGSLDEADALLHGKAGNINSAGDREDEAAAIAGVPVCVLDPLAAGEEKNSRKPLNMLPFRLRGRTLVPFSLVI